MVTYPELITYSPPESLVVGWGIDERAGEDFGGEVTFVARFRCDQCKKWAQAKYNGEHYLPPSGWSYVSDSNGVEVTGAHLCKECTPKPLREYRKEDV